MSEELRAILNVHLDEQASLANLKLFANAYDFLLLALDKSLDELPRFVWAFEVQTNTEKQIVKIIQFILTDFAGKCHQSNFITKSERTY